MKAEVLVYRDEESLISSVAWIVAKTGQDAVRERGIFTFVLSGGATPRILYRRLAGAPFEREAPWDRTHIFWGDERAVPPDHAESNFRMAKEELIDGLGLSLDAVHRMFGEIDPEESAAMYEAGLRNFFESKVSPPRFDLVLLGIGADGHTASLFPGAPALSESRRWVAVSETPKPGAKRLTLTVPVLNMARRIVFLIVGRHKAGILREVLEGPRDPMRLPAQLVMPGSGELFYCVDVEAGALLTGDGNYTLERVNGS